MMPMESSPKYIQDALPCHICGQPGGVNLPTYLHDDRYIMLECSGCALIQVATACSCSDKGNRHFQEANEKTIFHMWNEKNAVVGPYLIQRLIDTLNRLPSVIESASTVAQMTLAFKEMVKQAESKL